jgi:hypothetical protein
LHALDRAGEHVRYPPRKGCHPASRACLLGCEELPTVPHHHYLFLSSLDCSLVSPPLQSPQKKAAGVTLAATLPQRRRDAPQNSLQGETAVVSGRWRAPCRSAFGRGLPGVQQLQPAPSAAQQPNRPRPPPGVLKPLSKEASGSLGRPIGPRLLPSSPRQTTCANQAADESASPARRSGVKLSVAQHRRITSGSATRPSPLPRVGGGGEAAGGRHWRATSANAARNNRPEASRRRVPGANLLVDCRNPLEPEKSAIIDPAPSRCCPCSSSSLPTASSSKPPGECTRWASGLKILACSWLPVSPVLNLPS